MDLETSLQSKSSGDAEGQQQQTATVEPTWQGSLLELLRGAAPGGSSQVGFVVAAKGVASFSPGAPPAATSLQPVQRFCLDTGVACLTARYRVRGTPALGSALAGFVRDLSALGDHEHQLPGVLLPPREDPAWREVADSLTASGPFSEAAAKPELIEGDAGALDLGQLAVMFRALDEDPDGPPVVVLIEVVESPMDAAIRRSWLPPGFPEPPIPTPSERAVVGEWENAEGTFFSRLPRRLGLVVSGLHDFVQLDSAVVQIVLPSEAGDQASTPTRTTYLPSALRSDRPAQRDRLGMEPAAAALARLLLHPQTTALTVGIHGPWGKGKSSFMGFLRAALVEWSAANRDWRRPELRHIDEQLDGLEEDRPAGHGVTAPAEGDLQSERQRLEAERERLWKQMEHAAKGDVVTVWFNAWRYQDATQVWSGLAASVTAALESALPRRARLATPLVHFRRRNPAQFWLGLALPAIGAVVLVGAILAARAGYLPERLAEAINGNEVLPGGSAAVIAGILFLRLRTILVPLSEKVFQYVRRPDYRDRTGYQHHVMEDLRFVHARLGPPDHRPRVVVFIDDLDRCTDDTVVEVLQAVHLILGESDFFVVMGVAVDMLERAVRHHYRHPDDPLPVEFSRQYLQKILQMSFHLPDATPDRRAAFLADLFSPTARRDALRPEASTRDGEETAGPAPAAPESSLHYDLSRLIPPVTVVTQEVEDTADELIAFQEFQKVLDDNPRRLKRLVNVHRLLKIVLQDPEGSWPRERQRKLVRWLVFCSIWPRLIDDALRAARTGAKGDCLAAVVDHSELNPRQKSTLRRFLDLGDEDDRLSPEDLRPDGELALAAYLTEVVLKDIDEPSPALGDTAGGTATSFG